MSLPGNTSGASPNDLPPRQGGILIAEPFLQDKHFRRSVVLLVEYAPRCGAMGLVMNKKSDLLLNSFFADLEALPDIPLYLGGPVSVNRLFFIHSLDGISVPNALPVSNNLFFDGDFNVIRRYLKEGHPAGGKIKFFLGYAGWTKGQLEKEVQNNTWVPGRATNQWLLNAQDEDFWKHSLRQMGSHYKAWANFPKDPCLN